MGAFVSVILKVILVLFIYKELLDIFTRRHPKVGVKYRFNDFTSDQSVELIPSELGFDIAVGFRSGLPTLLDTSVDPTILDSMLSGANTLIDLDPQIVKVVALIQTLEYIVDSTGASTLE